ncbi:MAG: hypothetical protein ACKVT0_06095 [Planctomycetaceae bacterium]
MCAAIFKLGIGEFDKYADDENPVEEYWAHISLQAHVDHFRKMLVGGQLREKMYLFEQQFGKHGASSDIRWFLAFTDGTMNPVFGDLPKTENDSSEILKNIINSAEHLAEFQVRRFLKEPKILDRYCRFVVWQKIPFTRGMTGLYVHTRNGLANNRDPNRYWWFARDFIVAAHVMGRDDLLKDVEPNDLRPKSKEFFEWFRKEGYYLRPNKDSTGWKIDLGEKERKEAYLPFLEGEGGELPPLPNAPKFPFDDWEGPPPSKNFLY